MTDPIFITFMLIEISRNPSDIPRKLVIQRSTGILVWVVFQISRVHSDLLAHTIISDLWPYAQGKLLFCYLTLSQTSPCFYLSQYKSLENTMGKGEIARYEQYPLFQ